MTITEIERPQLTWSRLSPLPVTGYHEASDSHITYWNGVSMVRANALVIVAGNWGIMRTTPKMKAAAYQEFLRAYRLNAFGHQRWDELIRDSGSHHARLVRYLCSRDQHFLANLAESHTPQEALSWFTSDHMETISD